MSTCVICDKFLEHNHIKFCSVDCASDGKPRKQKERVCKGCGKIEYVAGVAQLSRKCRSCSKIGNTSSKNMSLEAKNKISTAKKGTIPWNKGKTGIYSGDTRYKMGTHRGKNLSEEHKQSIKVGLNEYYNDHKGPNAGITRKAESNAKTKASLKKIRATRIHTTLEEAKTYCKSLNLELIHTEFSGTHIAKTEKLTVKCLNIRKKAKSECGQLYETTLNYLEFGANRACKGCSFSTSKPEEAIFQLVKEALPEDVKILRNKRPPFLEGKELDIWIPEKNVAIEFHGLVHHSERPIHYKKDLGTIKTLHEFKYLRCKAQGIRLIQIFEDEWRDKRPILESMIKQRLGLVSNRIFARKTIARKLDKKEASKFFNSTHISGNVASTSAWGLFFEGELVSAISMRKTWNKSYGENLLEIARFSSKLNTQVLGGFQKLFKRVKEEALKSECIKILTYADCRFGSGEVYLKAGFKALPKTKPNYFYEKGGERENRFKHRKSKELKGNTEREQQNFLGWFAIYDAGNEVYTLNLD